MDRAKIFIFFAFLLAFPLQVSAQDEKPKIVWKNMKEKYERFEDVKPTILNSEKVPVFMPRVFLNSIPYGNIRLLKFNGKQNKFMPNYAAFCGTITKKEWKDITQSWSDYKLDSNAERQITFDDLEWHYLVKSEIGDAGFTELPNYDGTGKYKFQISFSQDRKNFFIVESPEFIVIDKNFKK